MSTDEGDAPAVRPVVEQFSREMERQLRENRNKGGWATESTDYLLSRLRQEVDELEQAISNATAKGQVPLGGYASPLWWTVIEEAADVANFAMMLADHAASSGVSGLADLHRMRLRMEL